MIARSIPFLLLGVLLSPSALRAETEARVPLLAEAQDAHNRGDHEAAFRAANRALQLRSTPALRRFLANELLELHRPAESYEQATHCLEDAESAPQHYLEALRAQCARMQLTAAEQVGRIVLRLPQNARGLRILLNDTPVPETRWNTALMVNPGAVILRAEAPGMQPFEQRVNAVRAGERHVIIVRLDALAAPSNSVPAGPQPNIAAWSVLALGGASLLSTAVLAGVRSTELTALDMRLSRYCTPTENSVWNCAEQDRQAVNPNTLSSIDTALWVTGITGGVLLSAGTTWLILTRQTRSRPAVNVHRNVLSLGFEGSF